MRSMPKRLPTEIDMKEYGHFGDFNDKRKRSVPFSKLKKTFPEGLPNSFWNHFSMDYPLITLLLSETTRFYEEVFGDLISHVAREKRQLVFETPNRVELTNEYELENLGTLADGDYFLFNTRDRLSWLTIYLENEHVPVVSRNKVCDLLSSRLNGEDEKMALAIGWSREQLLNVLYNLSDGKPCFIHYTGKRHSIKLRYYDSVQKGEGEGVKGCKLLVPIIEKALRYNYQPVSSSANNWFYTRAPKDFQLEAVVPEEKERFIERQSSQDPEIHSLVIRGNEGAGSIPFNIKVKVPEGLKWWYYGLYYAAWVASVFLALSIILLVVTDVKLLQPYSVAGVYALFAAMITTRGWLMHDAHVFNELSKIYTLLSFVMLAEAIVYTVGRG